MVLLTGAGGGGETPEYLPIEGETPEYLPIEGETPEYLPIEGELLDKYQHLAIESVTYQTDRGRIT